MPRPLLLLVVFALAGGVFWLLLGSEPSRAPGGGETAFPAPRPTDDPPTDDPWGDANWLVPHFETACEAVEAVCGEPFEMRPSLRIGTGIELSDLYRLGALEHQRRYGGDPVPDLPGNEEEFARYARLQFGRYFREEHAITISREAYERFRKRMRSTIRGGDGVKLVLVHEVAHAWQAERFPRLWIHQMFQPDKEAAECAWATMEGHAQHVTRLVAERWGMGSVFEDFRAYFAGVDRRKRGRDPKDSELWRVYVGGQDFIEAVYEAGGSARVLEALEHPPGTHAELFEPRRWLGRDR